MGCKGICIRYKSMTGGRYLRYLNGTGRCQVCEIFITPDGINVKPSGKFCKCCGNKIRSKPRTTACKKAYEQVATIKR